MLPPLSRREEENVQWIAREFLRKSMRCLSKRSSANYLKLIVTWNWWGRGRANASTHTHTHTHICRHDEGNEWNNENDDWPTCRKKCNGEGWRAGSLRALSFCIIGAKYEEGRSSRFQLVPTSARCLIVNERLYRRRDIWWEGVCVNYACVVVPPRKYPIKPAETRNN